MIDEFAYRKARDDEPKRSYFKLSQRIDSFRVWTDLKGPLLTHSRRVFGGGGMLPRVGALAGTGATADASREPGPIPASGDAGDVTAGREGSGAPGGGREPSHGEPGAPRYRPALKRAADIALSATGLVVLAPLLLGIALTIKATSRGPVLFRQARYGRDGELFTILKFRTMYTDRCDLSGVAQTRKDDPRITPIGRFLRCSSFDEFPQLWNVLRGDMSLVGPRPHVPNMLAAGVPYEEFHPHYMRRHSVRPGITGLAQVNGCRGETVEEQAARMRLAYDLQYVENFSNRRDIQILAKTLWSEFVTGRGY